MDRSTPAEGHKDSPVSKISLRLKRDKSKMGSRKCDKLYSLVNNIDFVDIKRNATWKKESLSTVSSASTNGFAVEGGDTEMMESMVNESENIQSVPSDDRNHRHESLSTPPDQCVSVSYEDFLNNLKDEPTVDNNGDKESTDSGSVFSPVVCNDDITLNAEKNKKLYGSIQRFFPNSKSSQDSDSQSCSQDNKRQITVDIHSETIPARYQERASVKRRSKSNVFQMSDDKITSLDNTNNAVCDSSNTISDTTMDIANDAVCSTGNIAIESRDDLNASTVSEDCCIVSVQNADGTNHGSVSSKDKFLHSRGDNIELEDSYKSKRVQSTLGFVVPKPSPIASSQSDLGADHDKVSNKKERRIKKIALKNAGNVKKIKLSHDLDVKSKKSKKVPTKNSGKKVKTNSVDSDICESDNTSTVKLQSAVIESPLRKKKNAKSDMSGKDNKSEQPCKDVLDLRRSPRTRSSARLQIQPTQSEETDQNIKDIITSSKCKATKVVSNLPTSSHKKKQILTAKKLLNSAKRRSTDATVIKLKSSSNTSKRTTRDKDSVGVIKIHEPTARMSEDDDVVIVGHSDGDLMSKKKRSTPKKAPTSLAPLFVSKKTLTDLSPNTPQSPIDIAALERKKAFLMRSSNAPKPVTDNTLSHIELPHFPDIPHVQQVEQATCIKSDAQGVLNYRDDIPYMPPKYGWQNGFIDVVDDTKRSVDPHLPHEILSSSAVNLAIKEIIACNRSHPAPDVYESLKSRKIAHDSHNVVSQSLSLSTTNSQSSSETIVIDMSPEQTKVSQKKGSKLKLNKENKKAEPDTKAPSPDTATCIDDTLWTDKYKPRGANEIVGNSRGCRRLTKWLEEWKLRSQKETKKLQKQMRKDLRKQRDDNSGSGWESEGEFKGELDDDDELDDGFCNTVILSGPHGVGKTSSVYALAQQLGYQVFEVNTTSSRNGKKILAQLQEVTQSHQVSKQHLSKVHNVQQLSQGPISKSTPTNKMPTAFTNLFKHVTKPIESTAISAKSSPGKGRAKNKDTSENSTKRKRSDKFEKTPKKKKRKGHDDVQIVAVETRSNDSNTRGLHLSSLSLILFDEVDVVFEDDRGFLSTIQSFMSSTKRPIILTTSDPNFAKNFDGYFENIAFKVPNLTTVTSYLQLVCLVEGIRTDPADIQRIVSLHGSDIRRCLLSLQTWVTSGGGVIVRNHKITTDSRENRILHNVLMSPDLTVSYDASCDSTTNSQPEPKSITATDGGLMNNDDNAMFIDMSGDVSYDSPMHTNFFSSVIGQQAADCGRLLDPVTRDTKCPPITTAGNVLESCRIIFPTISTIHVNLHKLINLPSCTIDQREWPIRCNYSPLKKDKCNEISETGVKRGKRKRIRILEMDTSDSEQSGGENDVKSVDNSGALNHDCGDKNGVKDVDDDSSEGLNHDCGDENGAKIGDDNDVKGVDNISGGLNHDCGEDDVNDADDNSGALNYDCGDKNDINDVVDNSSGGLNHDGCDENSKDCDQKCANSDKISVNRDENQENVDTNGAYNDKHGAHGDRNNLGVNTSKNGANIAESSIKTDTNGAENDRELIWKRQVEELSSIDQNERRIVSKSLDILLTAYDTTSFLDSYVTSPTQYINENTVSLSDGLLDELCTENNNTDSSENSKNIGKISSECERALLSHCRCRVEEVLMDEAMTDWVRSSVCVPVKEGETWLQLPSHKLRRDSQEDALRNVQQHLPLVIQRDIRGIAMDYLPYMRLACRSEKHRQAAKLKRRFLHYFDGISLNLKETTLNVLADTYT